MITPSGWIYFGCPTEFRNIRNQRRVQHAALVQVLNQSTVCLVVHRRHNVLHALDGRKRFRAMNVPRDFIEHGQECVDRYESDTRLDNPSSEEATLTESVHAVPFTDLLRLFAKVKGVSRLRAGHQAECRLEIFVQQCRVFGRFEVLDSLIHNVAHFSAAGKTSVSDFRRRE